MLGWRWLEERELAEEWRDVRECGKNALLKVRTQSLK